EIKVDIFEPGEFVDIIGISIGKGFQGGMKRWHYSGGPKTHGSMSHRRPGSIGASASPSRVFKGKHMPGHMGSQVKTIQNIKVVKVDTDNNLIMVKGSVAGKPNSYLIIKQALKKRKTEK
ncbi:MAG: 50S ribosomal protein L3, partial [Candidatus Omnitrophica bacterium]|nr:50S ribosomal protein L3 [Candidatus Omnitrophota bacterium]